ncbi:hypothetical protein [Streptomyces sp. NPDC101455]
MSNIRTKEVAVYRAWFLLSLALLLAVCGCDPASGPVPEPSPAAAPGAAR